MNMDKLIPGKDGAIWQKSLSNEFAQLTQGVGKSRSSVEKKYGTNTIFFIPKSEIPQGAKVTYTSFVCDIQPLKTKKHRKRLTVGGDRLEYEHDPSSPVVSLSDTFLTLREESNFVLRTSETSISTIPCTPTGT